MMRLVSVLLFLFLIFVSPLVVLFFYAASSSWTFPDILPASFDGRSIGYLFSHGKDISVSMLSSCGYSFAAVLVTLLMTILPAKVFARTVFPGKMVLEGLFLAPALIPPMAFAMGAHYFFVLFGVADTFAGVVLILSLYSYPYMLRALTAGYLTYGENLALCARNMGASTTRILLTIELPLLIPAIVAGGTIVFLVSFSEYFLVFLIGGGTVPSYSGYIFPLLNSSDNSVASLLTLLFVLVPVLLFIIIDRLVYGIYRKRGLL
ncbi:MAG: ABC transporter permease subunit [Desulfopila sp.]|jgi:putative spermidine/putrescine transport system permease protein|nr:ABC transporter permease subunit [Desulfopila sp.]